MSLLFCTHIYIVHTHTIAHVYQLTERSCNYATYLLNCICSCSTHIITSINFLPFRYTLLPIRNDTIVLIIQWLREQQTVHVTYMHALSQWGVDKLYSHMHPLTCHVQVHNYTKITYLYYIFIIILFLYFYYFYIFIFF